MNQTWEIFRYKGIPVRLHYSVLFFVPLYFFFSSYPQFELAPVFAGFMLVLVLAHEMGHAFVARALKVKVYAIEVYFLFGVCRHAAPHSRRAKILVAWGGVLAQLVVLFIALFVLETAPVFYQTVSFGYKLNGIFSLISHVFVGLNVLMIAINLVPVRGLDGFVAWDILPYLRSGTFFRRKSGTFKTGVRIKDRQRMEEKAKKTTEQIIVKLARKKRKFRVVAGGR